MGYAGGATPVNQFYTEASSTVRNKAGSAVAAGPICYLKGVTINPSANTCHVKIYDGSSNVYTETEVTYEDGRKGKITATLEIRDADVAEAPGKLAAE